MVKPRTAMFDLVNAAFPMHGGVTEIPTTAADVVHVAASTPPLRGPKAGSTAISVLLRLAFQAIPPVVQMPPSAWIHRLLRLTVISLLGP